MVKYGSMNEVSLSKLLPYMAAGTALAGLENKYVGENLPEELKKVNYGIGAATGALFGLGGREAQIAALSGLSIKQMGMFAVGQADKFRKQQQELTDTNLGTARINQETAKIDQANSNKATAKSLAFLVPAMLGAGSLAYYVRNHAKKKTTDRYQMTGSSGAPVKSKKIKMEIPQSALPASFFEELAKAEGNDRSYSQVWEKQPVKAATMVDPSSRVGLNEAIDKSWIGKAIQEGDDITTSIGNSAPVKALKTVGGIAAEFTGIPTAIRAARDLGSAAGYAGTSGPGNTDTAARYAVSGLGNTLMAIPSIRWGVAPIAGKLIGGHRLLRAVGKHPGLASDGALTGLRRKLVTNTPISSKWLLNHMMANRRLTKEEIAALRDPATRAAMKAELLNNGNPARNLIGNREVHDVLMEEKYKFVPKPFSSSGPKTLPGEVLHAGRYATHVGTENARRLALLMRRNPNASMLFAGMPIASLGEVRDQEEIEKREAELSKTLAPGENGMPGNMPVSSNLQHMFYSMTSPQQSHVLQQIRGR